MPDLEQTLTRIGRELAWPETPDLASSVTARLRAAPAGEAAQAPPGAAQAPPGAPQPPPGAEQVRPGARQPPADAAHAPPGPTRPARRRLALRELLPPAGLRRALVLALVSLLVLSGAVFAAVPGVRDAVLEFFGLQGATVERRETLPTPPPVRPLDLGTRTTLEAATQRLAFEPLVPADPGEPEAVYVHERAPGGELSLTYRPRLGLPRSRTTDLGLLVTEIRGDLTPEFFGKLAGPDSDIQRLRIDGERAVWIEGAEHFFFYRGPNGDIVENELRLAQNVLLLERGPLLVRLEGAFDRERAVEIAESLR
jgi:hypothetical protein